MSKQNNAAFKWWQGLSMNEQDDHRKRHKFFKHFNRGYVSIHKTAVEQMYEIHQQALKVAKQTTQESDL